VTGVEATLGASTMVLGPALACDTGSLDKLACADAFSVTCGADTFDDSAAAAEVAAILAEVIPPAFAAS